MALPSTRTEILQAIKAALAVVVWPAAIDAATPEIFGDQVFIAADFPAGGAMDIVRKLPAAVLVHRGEKFKPELEDFAETTVGIGLICKHSSDRTGENAITGPKGLFAMVAEVRKALRYRTDISDSMYLAAASGSVVLSDPENPGRDYVIEELTFVVEHQDTLPS